MISTRKLSRGDESDLNKLLGLYIEVFGEPDYPTDTSYLASLLDREEVMFFASYKSGEVIGGLTAYLLPSIYGDFNELYIYDIAVSAKLQGQGIGSQLLNFVKENCKTMHVHDIVVQADAGDTQARNFYKKNGGQEEDVRHFDFKVT